MDKQCVGCGELAKYANLNGNGECEPCSILCEWCELPARIVGDLDRDTNLCFDCHYGINKKKDIKED